MEVDGLIVDEHRRTVQSTSPSTLLLSLVLMMT
jgi:hypothetical protein